MMILARWVSFFFGFYLPSSTLAMLAPAECLPNDGLDDRACLQELLDATCADGGGTVHLPAGKWELSRAPQVSGTRDNASLWLECSDLTLEGEVGTELAMTGDGFASDWAGVRISAGLDGTPTERVTVRDLAISSGDAFNINEQTHLLMLGSVATSPGQISNVQLHHLRLRHPVRAEVAGDCLRFVGEAATPITYVDAGSIMFEACDRSGIAVQRGVQHVNLHDLMMINIGKTGIDMEPTGTGEISWFDMRNLQISSLTIAGQASQYTHDIILDSSNVSGRLGVIYARDVVLTGNNIAELADGAEGTLNVRGVERLTVTGNGIRRLAGSAAGSAIKISGVSGKFPTGLTLTGNTVTTEIGGPAIDIESVQDMTIAGNTISGGDSAAAAVQIRATGRDISGVVFSGNRTRGPYLYGLKLSGNPFNVNGVAVSGNYSNSITNGLRCENVLKFTGPVLHGGGYYAGASSAVSGCTGVSIVGATP